ncbi:type IV toxin-antitoxin system YeeU family antitoxin [Aeromonas veronii]|uniref:type IV toxin-antitoxin system YeeU family antitoxin n=1 Tax=Aeromonas veronii TaxID=654 RepID=UPI003D1AAB7E
MTPRFGARLIQRRYRLDFLSDRASLIGEWSEAQIDELDQTFPEIIKALEAKLLTCELDAQRQQCITIQHDGFTYCFLNSSISLNRRWASSGEICSIS